MAATSEVIQSPRNVRLKTLIGLRWFAVIGQATAVLVVHYWLEFELPLAACLSVIALSAWLNVAMRMHYRNVQRLPPRSVALLLGYDIAQLTMLMTLTGGIENPFAFLILAPVLIAAISLPLRYTLPLGVFAATCLTAIAFYFWPLPWTTNEQLVLPPLYIAGIWIANIVAIIFIGAYAWQVAEEGRLMADALTATELVLAREQHLSQLDGLAAAAAHELGTPLSTITVVAKELQNALGADSPYADDVRLLREQAQRCREILGKLSALPADGTPFHRARFSVLIEEVVAPHRNFGIAIDIVLPPDRAGEPMIERLPAILYGLGNLVENAVDFAAERVEIAVRWSELDVAVTISDDGPGFPSEILARIGEPYVTSRRRRGAESEESGLGLGFFIAKTLLERSGATLAFLNRPAPDTGAVVRVRWPREDFEALGGTQPLAGETQPLPGESQPLLGESEPLLGKSRPSPGESRPLPGRAPPLEG
jgi:two-component system sensor histidine kinase RegB